MRIFLSFICGYLKGREAVAATEAALVFPVMMTMLLGVFDTGYGILAAQKTIRASQVTADLLARHRSVDSIDVEEAVQAGILALNPFTSENFGIDIVSVEFDDDGDAQILWCDTRNMPPNQTAVESLNGLGGPGEGVVIVTVNYIYEPVFSTSMIGNFAMQEVSFVRGRLDAVVEHDGGGICNRG